MSVTILFKFSYSRTAAPITRLQPCTQPLGYNRVRTLSATAVSNRLQPCTHSLGYSRVPASPMSSSSANKYSYLPIGFSPQLDEVISVNVSEDLNDNALLGW